MTCCLFHDKTSIFQLFSDAQIIVFADIPSRFSFSGFAVEKVRETERYNLTTFDQNLQVTYIRCCTKEGYGYKEKEREKERER